MYDEIFKIIDDCNNLYAKTVRKTENQFEIILIDTSGEEDIIINDALVEKGLAAYDENRSELLTPVSDDENCASSESDWNESNGYERESSSVYSDEKNPSETHPEFSEFCFDNFDSPDFIRDFLQRNINQQSNQHPKINLPDTKPNVVATKERKVHSTKQINTGTTLPYVAKVPNVIWQQSDELIVLTISAKDNLAYNLQVTGNHLIYR